MRLTLTLPAEAEEALRRFAEEEGFEPDIAAAVALVEWLTVAGYLVMPLEIDEDTPVEGSA
jgi:hypothetical protein